MQALHFTATINASASKVWNTMLHHPTYELRTTAFSAGSTYEGSREQGAEIKFLDPSGQGMIAKIAEARLYEYVSIQHLGQMMFDETTQQLVTTMYDGRGYENYTFTSLADNETKVDIMLTAIPDEYVAMMSDMWPKALTLLTDLCV